MNPFSLGLSAKVGWRLFLANLQITLAYRGMMLLWTIQELLIPIVLLNAWLAVERVEGNPYQSGDYILYFLCVPIMMNLSSCWTVYSLPEQIRDGTLSRELLKPVHPLWNHVFDHLAMKTLNLFYFVLPIGFLSFWFWNQLPELHFTLSRLVLIATLVLLAVVLRFVMNTTLAMTGFWIEHVESLNLVLNQAVWAMLGGMIVPLETLPTWMQSLTQLLPYRYTMSFPIEVLRGHIEPSAIFLGILIASLWALSLFAFGQFLWRRGLREYTAYGG